MTPKTAKAILTAAIAAEEEAALGSKHFTLKNVWWDELEGDVDADADDCDVYGDVYVNGEFVVTASSPSHYPFASFHW